jgi:hypothetical protein
MGDKTAQFVTVMLAVMEGWIVQKYGYVPAIKNFTHLEALPAIVPVSQPPSVQAGVPDVEVCDAESALSNLTTSFTFTVSLAGLNLNPLMLMVFAMV